ncbi:hypothetical protein [Cytobacillus purgationiresistens]|uniref:Uncharacterized protein n=1 Tax=Cytobacillus purgationiresistens TaxID=863449 RepID=A0ABU0APQ6_9BACI|nr:hypothetical protein [Cytobacillus purgationiresistens]MDQ0272030.1 hypothetical protein [Cytobacillus purgationiresistens]
MFDPTAFENLRVVLEGHIYDHDLSGDISIIDRNDVFNSSKLSRQFDLSFTNDKRNDKDLYCQVILKADLANLAAELLPNDKSGYLAGCKLAVHFITVHRNDPILIKETRRIVKSVWGEDRIVNQIIKQNTANDINRIENDISVTFNRLISEDQIDDVIAMFNHMLETLHHLEVAVD